MEIYISQKIFYTKSIESDGKEITYGIIPNLRFRLQFIKNNVAYLENIDTGTLALVTTDMLNSKLFNKVDIHDG